MTEKEMKRNGSLPKKRNLKQFLFNSPKPEYCSEEIELESEESYNDLKSHLTEKYYSKE